MKDRVMYGSAKTFSDELSFISIIANNISIFQIVMAFKPVQIFVFKLNINTDQSFFTQVTTQYVIMIIFVIRCRIWHQNFLFEVCSLRNLMGCYKTYQSFSVTETCFQFKLTSGYSANRNFKMFKMSEILLGIFNFLFCFSHIFLSTVGFVALINLVMIIYSSVIVFASSLRDLLFIPFSFTSSKLNATYH